MFNNGGMWWIFLPLWATMFNENLKLLKIKHTINFISFWEICEGYYWYSPLWKILFTQKYIERLFDPKWCVRRTDNYNWAWSLSSLWGHIVGMDFLNQLVDFSFKCVNLLYKRLVRKRVTQRKRFSMVCFGLSHWLSRVWR